MLSPYTNLSYKDALKQAEEEYNLFKKMYPGATGDAQIKNEEIANQIKNGIQFEEKNDTSLNLKLANEMKYSAALFDDEYEFIEPNFPVLFINEADLNTDPITFSVLLDKEEFVNFIEKTKNETSNLLINKFGVYIDTKKIFYNNVNEYVNIKKELGYFQNKYDLVSNNIFEILVSEYEFDIDQAHQKEIEYKNIEEDISLNVDEKIFQKNEFDKQQKEDIASFKKSLITVPELCEELFNYQVQIIKLLIKLAEKLLDLYENQRNYFNSIVDFLKEYRKVYFLTIEYPNDQTELAYECIDTDIRIYELLSAEILKEQEQEEEKCKKYSDSENCENYFKTINILKEKIKKLKKDEQMLYSSNIDEITQMYVENPYLLITSKKQLNISYSIISMSYNINQLNIWKIYYYQTENLINKMIENYYKFMEKIIIF